MTKLAYTLCLAAEYTSGNVRQKYRSAAAAAEIDPSYNREREALEKCLPPDITIDEIEIRLGAAWIAPDIVRDFIADTLSISTKVIYTPQVAAWDVEAYSNEDTLENKTTYGLSYETYDNQKLGWVTKTVSGLDLVIQALNLKQPIIKVRKEPDFPLEYSMVLTTQAVSKQEELNDRFAAWCREDPDIAHALEKTYNERFNSIRYRTWDGSHLTLEGMSDLWRERIMSRQYQLDGIAMGVAQGGGIFFEVGLGKTVVGLAIAYERKRIGNCQSPWIVVKKQTLPDYVRVIREMYPQAKVLVANEDDLTTTNRQLFIARARAGDFDFVVMTQQQYEKIALSKAFCEKFYNDRIDELVAAGKAIEPDFNPEDKPSGKLHPTIKLILSQVAALKRKLKALSKAKDPGLTFEQTGCDLVIYDEYDEVKNLGYITKMERIVGLGSRTGCARSFDFEMKRLYIQQTHGNNRLVAMTGTFISNTMAEFWKTLMDLAREEMIAYGWNMFDAWAAQNGAIVTKPEVKHTGVIKMVSRFAKFVNLVEQLILLKSKCMIKRSSDPDVDIDKPQAKYITVAAPMSEFQQEFAARLVERAELCERDQAIKRCDLYWYDVRQMEQVRDNHPDPAIANYYPQNGWAQHSYDDKGNLRATVDTPYLKLLDYSEGPRKGKAVKRVDPREFINKHGQEAADLYLRYGPVPVRNEDDEGDEDGPVQEIYTYRMTQDNMLSISTAGRKMALDPRLVHWDILDDPTDRTRWAKHDNPDGKLHLCIKNVWGLYRHTRKWKATQIIFCDLSTPDGNNFTVYEALRQGLIAKGMPADQIAFIHDYDTDEARAELYAAMNAGNIAVLIASSGKAGVGVNIQQRLIAEHDYDCPWRPRELEQRRGRMLRPGNMFKRVLVFIYVTQGYSGNCGFDSFLWQCVEAKARFIYALLTSDLTVRHMEEDASDSPVFSAAEIKALSTGDVRIMDYVRLEADSRKLESLIQGAQTQIRQITGKTGWRSLHSIQSRLAELTQTIEKMEPHMPLLYEQADMCTNDAFTITIGSKDYTTKTAAGRAIWDLVDQVEANADTHANKYLNLGRYGGLDMQIYVQTLKEWKYGDDDTKAEVTSITPYIYLTTDWERIEVKGVKDHHTLGQKIETAYLKIFDDLVQLKSRRAAAEQELEKTMAALNKCEADLISLKQQSAAIQQQKQQLEVELGIAEDNTATIHAEAA